MCVKAVRAAEESDVTRDGRLARHGIHDGEELGGGTRALERSLRLRVGRGTTQRMEGGDGHCSFTVEEMCMYQTTEYEL